MTRSTLLSVLTLGLILVRPLPADARQGDVRPGSDGDVASTFLDESPELTDAARARAVVADRVEADFAAMARYRPGYAFWRHIFVIPDGRIVYGSAQDGRLLAVFPATGNWGRNGDWLEAALADVLSGTSLPSSLTGRRERVAELLEPVVGPVIHNATRGDFLIPNLPRYGSFLDEWAAIYERFAVPAEIGLAQAVLESGLSGRTRSSAGALGFCQWLPRNWSRLNALSPELIEVQNQTTQAPYCAAYLLVLSVKYGSFIPALSEHHSGGANVGRTVIAGEWLGGADVRDRYMMGSDFALGLRELSPRTFSDLYRTYGPRSHLYAEMIFGNAATVRALRDSIPQERIYAMRTSRALSMSDISRETGLSSDELKRFNPALVRQVPKGATLYLPTYVQGFGTDVSFWHRPPGEAFSAVLSDFVQLRTSPEEWSSPAFDAVIEGFQARFRATASEEGDVMATALAYAMQERPSYHRILSEYRVSPRILDLFRDGVERLNGASTATAPRAPLR